MAVIHMFNSASIYIGRDMKKFNEVRERLEAEHIKYKYKVRNRPAAFAGRGTIRGRTGSAGIPTETMYEYEILVRKNDSERAVRLINQR